MPLLLRRLAPREAQALDPNRVLARRARVEQDVKAAVYADAAELTARRRYQVAPAANLIAELLVRRVQIKARCEPSPVLIGTGVREDDPIHELVQLPARLHGRELVADTSELFVTTRDCRLHALPGRRGRSSDLARMRHEFEPPTGAVAVFSDSKTIVVIVATVRSSLIA